VAASSTTTTEAGATAVRSACDAGTAKWPRLGRHSRRRRRHRRRRNRRHRRRRSRRRFRPGGRRDADGRPPVWGTRPTGSPSTEPGPLPAAARCRAASSFRTVCTPLRRAASARTATARS